jgi:hypothetical protein
MAHWRKRNLTEKDFKAHLTGWSLAFSALAGMLLLLSRHVRGGVVYA